MVMYLQAGVLVKIWDLRAMLLSSTQIIVKLESFLKDMISEADA